jgi:hypothetical protein
MGPPAPLSVPSRYRELNAFGSPRLSVINAYHDLGPWSYDMLEPVLGDLRGLWVSLPLATPFLEWRFCSSACRGLARFAGTCD